MKITFLGFLAISAIVVFVLLILGNSGGGLNSWDQSGV